MAMTKLKEEMANAANKELNRINEQSPLFADKWDGIMKIVDRMTETKAAEDTLEAYIYVFRKMITGKDEDISDWQKRETTPLHIADKALNLACEAVQTAAMLMKYEMSLNPGAESEGE